MPAVPLAWVVTALLCACSPMCSCLMAGVWISIDGKCYLSYQALQSLLGCVHTRSNINGHHRLWCGHLLRGSSRSVQRQLPRRVIAACACSFLSVIAVERPHQIAQDDLDTYIFQADLSICTSFAV